MKRLFQQVAKGSALLSIGILMSCGLAKANGGWASMHPLILAQALGESTTHEPADQNQNGTEQEQNGTEQEQNGTEQEQNGTEQEQNGTEQEQNGTEQEQNGTEQEQNGSQ